MGQKDFDKKGEMVGLVVQMPNPLRGMVKLVFMESGFYVMEGIILMTEKGVFGLELIKKQCYWPKGIPSEEMIHNTQRKEVGDVDIITNIICARSYHIMTLKDTAYITPIITTLV